MAVSYTHLDVYKRQVLRHGSRFVKRKVREHPARAASRAEARYQKAAADYHFHTAAQEHPEPVSYTHLAFFMAGNTPEKRRLYAVFHFRY